MPSDEDLVQSVQSGDEKAFETLVAKYRIRIYMTISAFIDSPQDREDIAQETFINAYQNFRQLSKPERLGSWLDRIAQNQCRDWLRKNRVQTVPIDEVEENLPDSDDSPEQSSVEAERRRIIAQAIEALPQAERQIARAHYLEDASHDELVSRHDISYQSVSGRLFRAKRKLAKRLRHLLGGVLVPPTTTLKKIISGGFTAMKIGTVPKITVGVIAIVALVFIGSRQLLSPEGDSSPSVEVTASTTDNPDQSGSKIDTNRKNVVTASSPADEPRISTEEMEQIEDFFAQLEADDAQSGPETPQLATEMKVNQNTEEEYTPESSTTYESTMQSAEDVMNAYVDAFKNLDFEAMGLLMTGSLKDGFKRAESMGFPLMDPEESENLPAEVRQGVEKMVIEHLSRLTVVNSGYVGDEFHFELGGPPPELEIPGMVISNLDAPNELYKMRKENGLWRIYDNETLD